MFAHAYERGLTVERLAYEGTDGHKVIDGIAFSEAPILHLRAFLDEQTLSALYAAADAVLANSGIEPFGLVGLDVIAAGGIAVCGATGEEYAEAWRSGGWGSLRNDFPGASSQRGPMRRSTKAAKDGSRHQWPAGARPPRVRRSTVLAALAALTSSTALPSRGRSAELPMIRVAFDPIDAVCNLLTAQAEGYFTRAGVKVELQQMVNGSAGAAAVLSGALELSNINVASLLSAYEKKIPFTVMSLGEMYTSTAPTLQLLVANDSPLSTAHDMNGKTIAVNAVHGLASLASRAWMDKNGGDSTTLHFAEMPFSVMASALSQRRVDAIFVAEPGLGIAKRSGDARVLASANDAIAPVFLVAACVATRDWVAKNLDAARRFNQAMHEASIFANHNHEVTAEIDTRYMHVPIDAIRAMTRATFPEAQRAEALIQPVIDTSAKYGVVPPSTLAADMISKQVLR